MMISFPYAFQCLVQYSHDLMKIADQTITCFCSARVYASHVVIIYIHYLATTLSGFLAPFVFLHPSSARSSLSNLH